MDIAKLPIEKIFVFIAGIFPGATALFVYYLANPFAYRSILGANGLGYSTKVCIALALCFVVGNSLTMFLTAIGGAIGGVSSHLNHQKQPRWPEVSDTAPWRDPQWRKLAKVYLGDSTPNDTFPISSPSFALQMGALNLLPDAQKRDAEIKLSASKSALASDDLDWSNWYCHLDRLRIEKDKPDTAQHVSSGIRVSLQATAIYLALSMALVPRTRNWFCLGFCAVWLFMLFAEVYTVLKNASNPWYTWSKQLDFLAQANRELKVLGIPTKNYATEEGL